MIKDSIKIISKEFGLDWRSVMAFMDVETGAKGFSDKGKLIIQFEPAWFRKKQPYAPSGKWSVNKVDVQSKEWEAFSDAFHINKEAAMECTSIGMGQIMGFHYKRLGYETVGQMWDDAKKSLVRQIWQICKFIATDIKLISALRAKDWDRVASIYNGSGYKELAKRIGREPYDVSLEKAYKKYEKLY